MSRQLTVDDARQSLGAHVAAKGEEIRAKFGPDLGWNELQQILNDRTCVRYPCEVVFDSKPLQPGEFGCAVMNGARPDEGFKIFIHPFYLTHLDRLAHLVLYQLVVVNYGDFASADDAETFGASAIGISKEAYYQELGELTDELFPPGAAS